MTPTRTVLVVDDQPDLLDAMALHLRRRGYEVVTRNDGQEALDALEADLPDVAVIDMLLPGVSGFVVAQAVKEKSDGQVPVLMISGNMSAAHLDYAFAAGADRFLAKPFAPQKFAAVVEELCPLPAAPRTATLAAGS